MNQSEIDLAKEDLQVLHAIRSANRPPTTRTIKEELYWADDSGKVRYRLDKLEERGLIDSWQAPDRGEDHEFDPRVSELTPAGEEIADEFEDNDESLPLRRRVKKVEKQQKRMRETYGKVKQRIVALEEEVEQHDEDLDEINTRVDDIIRSLNASQTLAGERE